MRLKVIACVAVLAFAAALPAQTVKGKIISDSGGVPLTNVLITLMTAKGDTVKSIRSDANGDFIIRVKDPGNYHLRATRLAFTPVSTNNFQLPFRTILDVKLVMNRQSVLLSPVVVVGSRVMSGADMMSTEGFEWRRLRYTGFFQDTASLKAAGYPPFTVLLRNFVPGLYIVPGFTGNDELRLTVTGKECVPDLYRDGLLQGSQAVSHLNNANSADFYGIEVYRHPNIPIELQRKGPAVGTVSGDCAVIALWTKWYHRGGNGQSG
jgi:hypothetical protein